MMHIFIDIFIIYAFHRAQGVDRRAGAAIAKDDDGANAMAGWIWGMVPMIR